MAEALKEEGNSHFKAGKYLKAAAVYTQAMKVEPENAALYSNRAAAFLHLVKLTKALADAEAAISLDPEWEKGYFRKGCVLEAMERFEEAIAALEEALRRNPGNAEVASKIKRLKQVAREKKKKAAQAAQAAQARSMAEVFEPFFKAEEGEEAEEAELLSFVVQVVEAAMSPEHDYSPRVHFLLEGHSKSAPVVNIDKAFESPDTHRQCFPFLRQYALDSQAKAACLLAPKSAISYPQVWKGQGSRKWNLPLATTQSHGFFLQLESPLLRKLWFLPTSTDRDKGRTSLSTNPQPLDVSLHQLLPRIFKDPSSAAPTN